MAGKNIPLRIVIHEPSTDKGKLELARKAAQIHADAVLHIIQSSAKSQEQKKVLLDAVIEAALHPPAD